MIDNIKNKLAILEPSVIKVFNESEKHKGHFGYSDGNSHFKILIISDRFLNCSRIARHKLVYNILAQELRETVHSLSIHAYTKDEYKLLSNY